MIRQLEHLVLLPFAFLGKVLDWTLRPVVSFTGQHLLLLVLGGGIYRIFVYPYWKDILGYLHIR